MSTRARLAGSGRSGDAAVTWTVSDGTRGRRWREVIHRDGAIVHALLLETDASRRFSHLELAVAGVLVTLHPEADGTLHGNRVDASGISHIEGRAFGPDAMIRVLGSPLGDAAIAWAVAGSAAPSPTSVAAADAIVSRPIVVIDAAGIVHEAQVIEVAHGADGAWRIAGGAWFAVGTTGVPVLDGGRTDPLER